jgi:hypothetical protein
LIWNDSVTSLIKNNTLVFCPFCNMLWTLLLIRTFVFGFWSMRILSWKKSSFGLTTQFFFNNLYAFFLWEKIERLNSFYRSYLKFIRKIFMLYCCPNCGWQLYLFHHSVYTPVAWWQSLLQIILDCEILHKCWPPDVKYFGSKNEIPIYFDQ